MKTIEDYLKEGISRIILGSAAVKNPALVAEAVKEFGDRIAVGIDARDGMVATEGWMETSAVCYLELAMAMEQMGVAPEQTAIVGDQIFTDVLGGNRAGVATILVKPIRLAGNPGRYLRYAVEVPFRLLSRGGERL